MTGKLNRRAIASFKARNRISQLPVDNLLLLATVGILCSIMSWLIITTFLTTRIPTPVLLQILNSLLCIYGTSKYYLKAPQIQ